MYIYKKMSKKATILHLLLIFVLVFGSFGFVFLRQVRAAAFQEAFLRLTRMKASIATGGTVCAKPATAATEADVRVTFPSGFTVNSTASNWTVTTTNLPAGASAWVGIGTATSVSGQVVTFPSGELVVGTLYCFNFAETSTLTNTTAGNDKIGSIETRTSGPAQIDLTSYALSIVSEDTITVTATVPQTFSVAFSFDDDGSGVDVFTGNLSSTSVVSTDGTTITIGTNAESGYHVWVKSANAALNSASTGESIASPGTINDTPESLAAQEGWVWDANETTDSGTGDGNLTIDAEYNGADTNSGGHLDTNYQEMAICDGTTDADVITMIGRAKPSAVRAAANDYTDTMTVVAAGRF